MFKAITKQNCPNTIKISTNRFPNSNESMYLKNDKYPIDIRQKTPSGVLPVKTTLLFELRFEQARSNNKVRLQELLKSHCNNTKPKCNNSNLKCSNYDYNALNIVVPVVSSTPTHFCKRR